MLKIIFTSSFLSFGGILWSWQNLGNIDQIALKIKNQSYENSSSSLLFASWTLRSDAQLLSLDGDAPQFVFMTGSFLSGEYE